MQQPERMQPITSNSKDSETRTFEAETRGATRDRPEAFLPDEQTYGASLRRHANPPSDDKLKALELASAVIATIMALGPLTVFAIFGGAGYSL